MYQALYRKWRPKTFDEVAGQEHITVTLKNQVRTGRLSHAYLFTGTRGTGKTTCARILAKAVNCENPIDGNPCNTCRVCRGIDDGSIMDVVEIDAASNSSVDNVRQLRDEAVFSPAETRKRVYIIDEVHMLSASAFNALLKILEEPPEHLMFILATTELNKVLPTILSRCQRYAFKRIDMEALVGRLEYVAEQEQLNLTPEAAALIAGLSEGGLRDALSMLDQCAGRERIDTDTVYAALGLAGNLETAELLGLLGKHDTGGALEAFHRLWQNGKNPASLLGELSDLLRDLLLRTVAPQGGQALLSGRFDGETLRSLEGLFSPEAAVASMERLQAAIRDMRSGQARTVCELCLISLSEPELNDGLPALRQRIAALEARLSGAAALPAPPAPRQKAAPSPVTSAPPAAPSVPAAPAAPRQAASGAPAAPPREQPAPWEEAPPPPEDTDLPPWELAPPPEDTDLPPWEQGPPPEGLNRPAAEQPGSGMLPPQPRPEAPAAEPPRPAPEQAAPAAEGTASPEEGEALWTRLLARSSEVLPGGLSSMLGDPTQVVPGYRDGVLTIGAVQFLSYNMLDRPDVVARLTSLATELAGQPVAVKVIDGPPERVSKAPQPSRSPEEKLKALEKFPVVHFK